MRISRTPLTGALLSTVALALAVPAAATIALATPAMAQSQNPPAGPAAAAERERVDVNIFYEPLAEHGSWVRHPDYDYVFVPAGLDGSWRPYQEGRWLWTDDYGWYWDSAEPFAWATYHYGRWGYEPAYGWYWVPGDTWAPAWVTWRRGGGKTGWAPIAPDSRGYAYGAPKVMDPPVAESWVFVEDRYLAAPELALHVAPIAQIAAWLRDDPRIYRPVYQDGIVMTRFVDRRAFDGVIQGGIPARRVVFVDSYRDEFYDGRGGYVGVYGPRVAGANRVPPPPRFERELAQDRRILVRSYVSERVPGLAAPSAALLSVLDDKQRRQLREQRWSGNDRAYEREIDQLRARQRDRLQKAVQEANRDARETQQKRMEAIKARNQKLQQRVEQRQERAQQVIDKIRQERPNAVPARATDDARPGAGPGGARPNDARPNDARPDGVRPGAGAPDTPQRNPDAPKTPPDRTPNAAAPDTPRSGAPERRERNAEPDRTRQPDAPRAGPPDRPDRQAQPDQGRQPEAPPNRPANPSQARPDGDARPDQTRTPNRPPVPTGPDRGREDQPAPRQMDQPQNAPSPRADRERSAPQRATPEREDNERTQARSDSVRDRLNRAQDPTPTPPRSEPTTPPARERAQPSNPAGAAGGAARPAPAAPARPGGAGQPGGSGGAGDGPGRN